MQPSLRRKRNISVSDKMILDLLDIKHLQILDRLDFLTIYENDKRIDCLEEMFGEDSNFPIEQASLEATNMCLRKHRDERQLQLRLLERIQERIMRKYEEEDDL